MGLSIREAVTPRDRKRWVRLPFSLYRDHPYHVPPLLLDEVAYFDPRKNPNFAVSRARLFLALDGEQPVGRVCGIINPLEAEKLGWKRGRFGWFDCVDNQEVANRLLDTLETWFRAEGCAEMIGPHGFTDLDPEGLLVEGFEHLPTVAGSYNFSYYRTLLESYGLEKDVDYIEYRCEIPDESPLFERFRKRYSGNEDYRVVTCSSRKELLGHADAVWAVLEQSFAHLHGVVPLTKAQRDFYTKKYFAFLDPDFVKLTFSRNGELLGFFMGIPNLSRAFKRANGRLFPLGWWHIFREYRRPETVEFILAGAKPGLPTAMLTAITFVDMYDTLRRRGVRFMETNRELEDNTTVAGVWSKFKQVYSRRSRIYKTALT